MTAVQIISNIAIWNVFLIIAIVGFTITVQIPRIALYIKEDPNVSLIYTSGFDILRVIAIALIVDALFFLYLYYYNRQEEASNGFLQLSLSVIGIALTLILTLTPQIEKWFAIRRPKKIPLYFAYNYKQFGLFEEFLHQLETFISSVKNSEQASYHSLESLLRSREKIDSYWSLIELIRITLKSNPANNVEVFRILKEKLFDNKSITPFEKIKVLRYIIDAKLGLDYFDNIFSDLQIFIINPFILDLDSRIQLYNEYCTNLKILLRDETFSEETKKKLVRIFFLIFSEFNSQQTKNGLSDNEFNIELLEAICKEYAKLHNILKEHLPVDYKTFKETIAGYNTFWQRFIYEINIYIDQRYSIRESIVELQDLTEIAENNK